MRSRIVAGLASEVLGPRGGLRETITRSPLFEYITGILAPSTTEPPDPLEGQAELTGSTEAVQMKTPEETDQIPDEPVYPSFSPALNPQRLPHSMGLTFSLEGERPVIDICVTWGEYIDRGESRWDREPLYLVTGPVAIEEKTWNGSSAGIVSNAGDRPVRLHLISRKVGSARWRTSLFFANERATPEGAMASVGDHIFQPQIRVVFGPGTRLVPEPDVFQTQDHDPDQASLALLYRNKPVLARGHMCAAIWKEIDPQRTCSDTVAESTRPQGSLFRWEDAEIVPEQHRQQFRTAGVRTEFLPTYCLPMPDLQWSTDAGTPPLLDAARLAETWDGVGLRQALEPLASSYAHWIDTSETATQNLAESFKPAAARNIQECRNTLERLKEALALLERDDEVRLAFCFANKAMSVQFEWSTDGRSGKLEWRPFQLAFMLTVIPSIADPSRPDRMDCDLLWMATAAGKTEAYLGIIAFTLALRRLRAKNAGRDGDVTGGGTGVISRYTLRLLTIQQFRRTLRMITACEILRVQNLHASLPVGWRPAGCSRTDPWLWGSMRFSAGLWVGGGVTPNRILDSSYWDGRRLIDVRGAIGKLRGLRGEGEGEPAQIIDCPCCRSLLAVPSRGLPAGTWQLHLVCSSKKAPAAAPTPAELSRRGITVTSASVQPHPWEEDGGVYWTLSVGLTSAVAISAEELDSWWNEVSSRVFAGASLECARASRPGYFIRKFRLHGSRRSIAETEFEIFCPNPACFLNVHPWAEGSPNTGIWASGMQRPPDSLRWRPAPTEFRHPDDPCLVTRIPIPACMVDDQIYHRCPSVVVATVDKFARLPFEPKTASLFGRVDRYHALYGYYRQDVPPSDINAAQRPQQLLPDPRPARDGRGRNATDLASPTRPFNPPTLVLQDELHLIEGPLGSLTGAYEQAVDILASSNGTRCKYIASTATARQAQDQVMAVFQRSVKLFPPAGLDATDSFFVHYPEEHPLQCKGPGRLYVGLCAPGKGAQTPVLRTWSRLLQSIQDERATGATSDADIDPYWTLTGYFNAIRELAGARALYQEDIPERMQALTGGNPRHLDIPTELSSRISSTDLPAVLEDLNIRLPAHPPDAVLTTSMFGVGVDIPRLGLMVVHGQPKKASEYIQATGRIGRAAPGLVITFLRATRPRDLSHYEFFTGYHGMLHRFVEPITVFPFAPGVRELATGPVAVAILRCGGFVDGNPVDPGWKIEQHIRGGTSVSGAPLIATRRMTSEVEAIADVVERRAAAQPPGRRPEVAQVRTEVEAALDRWHNTARRRGGTLVYWEYATGGTPNQDVVLGDALHERTGRDVVFRNTPQSLRDIEETFGVEV